MCFFNKFEKVFNAILHWTSFLLTFDQKNTKPWFYEFLKRPGHGNDTENGYCRPGSSQKYAKVRFLRFFRSADEKWTRFLAVCAPKWPTSVTRCWTPVSGPWNLPLQMDMFIGKALKCGSRPTHSIGYPLLKLLKIIDFHRFRRFDHQKSAQNKDR